MVAGPVGASAASSSSTSLPPRVRGVAPPRAAQDDCPSPRSARVLTGLPRPPRDAGFLAPTRSPPTCTSCASTLTGGLLPLTAVGGVVVAREKEATRRRRRSRTVAPSVPSSRRCPLAVPLRRESRSCAVRSGRSSASRRPGGERPEDRRDERPFVGQLGVSALQRGPQPRSSRPRAAGAARRARDAGHRPIGTGCRAPACRP